MSDERIPNTGVKQTSLDIETSCIIISGNLQELHSMLDNFIPISEFLMDWREYDD